jgi:hypothetical protein
MTLYSERRLAGAGEISRKDAKREKKEQKPAFSLSPFFLSLRLCVFA